MMSADNFRRAAVPKLKIVVELAPEEMDGLDVWRNANDYNSRAGAVRALIRRAGREVKGLRKV